MKSLTALLAFVPLISFGNDEPRQEATEEAAKATERMQKDVAEGNTDETASVTKAVGAAGVAAYVVDKVLEPISDAKDMAQESRPDRVLHEPAARPDPNGSIGDLRQWDNERIERGSSEE